MPAFRARRRQTAPVAANEKRHADAVAYLAPYPPQDPLVVLVAGFNCATAVQHAATRL